MVMFLSSNSPAGIFAPSPFPAPRSIRDRESPYSSYPARAAGCVCHTRFWLNPSSPNCWMIWLMANLKGGKLNEAEAETPLATAKSLDREMFNHVPDVDVE